MFAKFSSTSEKCSRELYANVTKLGGTPAESTKTTGKCFRMWMDAKATLTGKDPIAISNSCKYGEAVAKDTYKKVLKNDAENLSAEQQAMIKAQRTLLKSDQDKAKSMRDLILAV